MRTMLRAAMGRPTRPTHRSRRPVRRSMALSSLEGMVAEWVTACAGGGALTAWALHLGAGAATVALLGALPALAQTLQLPAARLSRRLGPRRLAVAASLAARQPYLLLVPVPWLPIGNQARLALLTAVAASTAALSAFAQNAWLTWTADLFRGPVRASFLGRRAGRTAVSGAVGALCVGLLLDRSPGGSRSLVLAALAAAAWAAGIGSAWLLSRQHVPRRRRRGPAARGSTRAALSDGRVLRGLGYACTWNAALGLTAAVTGLFMIQRLGLGFLALAVHGLGIAVGFLLAGRLWGRVLGRAGVGRVLVFSSLGAAALPFLWLAASAHHLWPLAVDALLGGALLSGQSLAAANLPLEVAPRGKRSEVLAAFSSVGGLSFAAAAVAGGLVAQRVPVALFLGRRALLGSELVFAAGGTVRLAAAAAAARIFRSPSRGGEELAEGARS